MEFIDSLLLNFVDQASLPTAQIAFWAVVAVIVLLLVIFVVRRLSRPRLASGSRSKKARLAITDAARVDEHGRSVVLLRRDDMEHLLLIGGPNDLVIEANIRKLDPANAAPASAQTAAHSQVPAAAAAAATAAPVAATAAQVSSAKSAEPYSPPSASPAFEKDMQAVLEPASASLSVASAAPSASVKPSETILPPPSKPAAPPTAPSSPSLSAERTTTPGLAKPAMPEVTSATLRAPEPVAQGSTIDPPKPAAPSSSASATAPTRREPPSLTEPGQARPKADDPSTPPATPRSAADEMEALLSEIELPKKPA